jgi:hypothetical protein
MEMKKMMCKTKYAGALRMWKKLNSQPAAEQVAA